MLLPGKSIVSTRPRHVRVWRAMRIARCVIGSSFAPQARSKKEHASPPPTNDPVSNANDSPHSGCMLTFVNETRETSSVYTFQGGGGRGKNPSEIDQNQNQEKKACRRTRAYDPYWFFGKIAPKLHFEKCIGRFRLTRKLSIFLSHLPKYPI